MLLQWENRCDLPVIILHTGFAPWSGSLWVRTAWTPSSSILSITFPVSHNVEAFLMTTRVCVYVRGHQSNQGEHANSSQMWPWATDWGMKRTDGALNNAGQDERTNKCKRWQLCKLASTCGWDPVRIRTPEEQNLVIIGVSRWRCYERLIFIVIKNSRSNVHQNIWC